tara:strand:- start:121 stop:225 length:105 start_codon:yes stop_codon:yes gene_type:complete
MMSLPNSANAHDYLIIEKITAIKKSKRAEVYAIV